MNKIIITGIGIVSALGIGKQTFLSNCCQATSGLKPVKNFDTTGFSTNIAGWIDNFKPADFMPSRAYRKMSRISRLAVAASLEAIRDSGLELSGLNSERVAIIMGTAYGSSSYVADFYSSLLEYGPRGAQPFLFPDTVPNAPASQIAIFHGITGPNTTFCQNEISAENAIFYARNLLLQDQVDVVLVGGADELAPIQMACYDALGIINPVKCNNNELPQPKPGGGIILGEGAGILVMEKEKTAQRRGAKIYGKLESVILRGADAPLGHYATDGIALEKAITAAISQAGLNLFDIDHLDVAANFSKELDLMEYTRLSKIFASQNRLNMVTPLKYLMGSFGGAGIIRAAAILLSMHLKQSLPQVNIGVLNSAGNSPLKWDISDREPIQKALMTSTTFGGGSSALIFSAP